MARRKRASMREGPLADLFRSTEAPDDPPEAPDLTRAAAASREPDPEPLARARPSRRPRRAAPSRRSRAERPERDPEPVLPPRPRA